MALNRHERRRLLQESVQTLGASDPKFKRDASRLKSTLAKLQRMPLARENVVYAMITRGRWRPRSAALKAHDDVVAFDKLSIAAIGRMFWAAKLVLLAVPEIALFVEDDLALCVERGTV